MSTIATDGNMMACDGRVTEGDFVTQNDYRKIRRLTDGRIVGFAGNAFNDDAFCQWLEKGGEMPAGINDDFSCLVLLPGGDVVTYDEHGRMFVEKPPYAIGSGRKWAIAAMELGKTPKEAVAFACRFDIYSGGEIITISRHVRDLAA